MTTCRVVALRRSGEKVMFLQVYVCLRSVAYLWCQVPSWFLVPCLFREGGGKVSLVPYTFGGEVGWICTAPKIPYSPWIPTSLIIPYLSWKPYPLPERTLDQRYPTPQKGHANRDTQSPQPQKAGGVHPTGMHSC